MNAKLAEFFECAIKIIESINLGEFSEGKDRIELFDVFVNDMFVPALLNRPKEEVPEDIRDFSVEWHSREDRLANMVENFPKPPEASEKLDDEAVRETVQKMDTVFQEFQQFRNWLTSKAPAGIPEKFITLTAENFEMMYNVIKLHIDVVKWSSPDLFPNAEFPKL